MLAPNAFGNYRDLLEAVSLHPMMGIYLTSLRNRKADPRTGRVPDENYAREVMQLFSIGLLQLNADGSVKHANGAPMETYTPDDIAGLAKVFTGFSWDCPDRPTTGCFNSRMKAAATPTRTASFKPMLAYPQYHSTEEKTLPRHDHPGAGHARPERPA